MYTRAKSLPILYIRNIIPEGMGIPLLGYRALSGRPDAAFNAARELRLVRVLGR